MTQGGACRELPWVCADLPPCPVPSPASHYKGLPGILLQPIGPRHSLSNQSYTSLSISTDQSEQLVLTHQDSAFGPINQ